MADALKAVIGAALITILLLLGTSVIGDLAETEEGITSTNQEAVVLGENDTYVTINDGKGTDETVYKTRGYAVNLTGATDSFVETDEAVTFATDKNWTMSVWGRVDSGSQSNSMSVLSANGRVVVWYDGSNTQWSAWYYDESERNTYRVNVSAPNQPSTYSNVMVRANGTDLTIWRNNTVGETADLTVTNSADAPNPGNFDGRLEELRVFDEPLDSTNRTELVNQPVEQQPDTDRTARVMFDERTKDDQTVLFADTSMSQSNVTFSSGFPEQVMQPKTISNDIAGTSDYDWKVNGPQISPLSSGELAGAPVAYVDYTYEDTLFSLVEGWGEFASLAALIPILVIGSLIVLRLRE